MIVPPVPVLLWPFFFLFYEHIWILILAIALYTLPYWLAHGLRKEKPHRVGIILVISLFTGPLTLIGWLIALFWMGSSQSESRKNLTMR